MLGRWFLGSRRQSKIRSGFEEGATIGIGVAAFQHRNKHHALFFGEQITCNLHCSIVLLVFTAEKPTWLPQTTSLSK
jgi:hypothetical protein